MSRDTCWSEMEVPCDYICVCVCACVRGERDGGIHMSNFMYSSIKQRFRVFMKVDIKFPELTWGWRNALHQTHHPSEDALTSSHSPASTPPPSPVRRPPPVSQRPLQPLQGDPRKRHNALCSVNIGRRGGLRRDIAARNPFSWACHFFSTAMCEKIAKKKAQYF